MRADEEVAIGIAVEGGIRSAVAKGIGSKRECVHRLGQVDAVGDVVEPEARMS